MQEKRKQITLGLLLVVLLILGTRGTALASDTPELQINGGTPIVGSSGAVSVVKTTVDGWSIALEFGLSNSPSLGPAYGIELISATVSCTNLTCESSPLTVSLSDIDFTTSTTAFVTSLTSAQYGSTASLVQTAVDSALNGYFSSGTSIGTVGPFTDTSSCTKTTPCSFFGTATGGGPAPATYSLTLTDTFNANGNPATFTVANGDIEISPEPGTMVLFGSGLLAFGVIARRRLSALFK